MSGSALRLVPVWEVSSKQTVHECPAPCTSLGTDLCVRVSELQCLDELVIQMLGKAHHVPIDRDLRKPQAVLAYDKEGRGRALLEGGGCDRENSRAVAERSQGM